MEQIINGEHVLIGGRFAGSSRSEGGVRYRFAPHCHLSHFACRRHVEGALLSRVTPAGWEGFTRIRGSNDGSSGAFTTALNDSAAQRTELEYHRDDLRKSRFRRS